ncbi:hypothetical protein K0M31_005984 [Melipona bicolor]|uniref:Uncharacterized protein n=1 Tax=Melipona bicolor TaxID=60889 RepID=A0AA40FSK7_9HYME|nr:hypothetical protein K0M31_005984 [Melipona bicolor]
MCRSTPRGFRSDEAVQAADTRKSGRREKSRKEKKKKKKTKRKKDTRKRNVFSANQRAQASFAHVFGTWAHALYGRRSHHVPESANANATSTCKINYKYSRANEFPSLVISDSSFRASFLLLPFSRSRCSNYVLPRRDAYDSRESRPDGSAIAGEANF